jgi:phosphohistidine phosphatase
MKKLYLLRHAEAQNDFSIDDKERALSEHGKIQSYKIGEYLKAQDITIDLALCSSANRTKMTLGAVIDAGAKIKKTTFQDSLYNAPTSAILDSILGSDASIERLLVVAHNPGIHQLAHMMAEKGDIKEIQKLSLDYAPATLSIYTIESDTWAKITKEKIALDKVITPK